MRLPSERALAVCPGAPALSEHPHGHDRLADGALILGDEGAPDHSLPLWYIRLQPRRKGRWQPTGPPPHADTEALAIATDERIRFYLHAVWIDQNAEDGQVDAAANRPEQKSVGGKSGARDDQSALRVAGSSKM